MKKRLMNPFKRLIPSALILLIVIIVGTTGYQVLENWSFLDSFYMVAIRRADGSFDLQPDSASVMKKGDIFVVIGTQEQIVKLDKMLC